MRKITMRDFRWMGKPDIKTRDHRGITLSVAPHMRLPKGPLLLAVTDDDFHCDMTLTLSGKQVFTGVSVYHLDTDFVAVGLSKDSMEIHVMIHGYHNYSKIPYQEHGDKVIWSVRRSGSHAAIGYRFAATEPTSWIGNFSLPGAEHSISFGPYFSNEGSEETIVSLSALEYHKESRQPLAQQ